MTARRRPAAELLITGRARPFLPYEIPLGIGTGDSARLVLPVDMTAEEAERICGVIRSLAFTEPALASPLPSGSADD